MVVVVVGTTVVVVLVGAVVVVVLLGIVVVVEKMTEVVVGGCVASPVRALLFLNIGHDPVSVPAFRQYNLWSALPTYTYPPDTAGDE